MPWLERLIHGKLWDAAKPIELEPARAANQRSGLAACKAAGSSRLGPGTGRSAFHRGIADWRRQLRGAECRFRDWPFDRVNGRSDDHKMAQFENSRPEFSCMHHGLSRAEIVQEHDVTRIINANNIEIHQILYKLVKHLSLFVFDNYLTFITRLTNLRW